jgi:hypothetical protein
MQYLRENTLIQDLLRKALRLREQNFHRINRITQKGHVGDVASSLGNALLTKNKAMHKFLLRLTRKHRLLPK